MSMVVIGTIFVDIKGYPYDKYIPTGRNSGAVETVYGGVCRNIVEDIANVELRPTFISTVDETPTGTDIIKRLRNHKVDTRYIKAVPDGMGTWLVIFNNDGDVAGSISKRFSTDGIYDIVMEKGDEIFSNADCILTEIDMDRKLLKLIFELADKYKKPVYTVVSNMSIAVQRRDYFRKTECFVCNKLEAGILFGEDYEGKSADEMVQIVKEKAANSGYKNVVITLGGDGAVYANDKGEFGHCPATKVDVKDTTGAGDAFFAGVCIGLNYGKTLAEACEIGTKLASSVIVTTDNSCPRFLPSEFGIEVDYSEDNRKVL